MSTLDVSTIRRVLNERIYSFQVIVCTLVLYASIDLPLSSHVLYNAALVFWALIL